MDLDLSSNAITIIVGGVGIVASYGMYRRGKKQTDEVRGLLKQAALDFVAHAPNRDEVVRLAHQAGANSAAAEKIASSLTTSSESSAIDVLVHASLGALQNARGDVDLPRLRREVGHAAGRPAGEDIENALRRLRTERIITWDAPENELSGVKTLHVITSGDTEDPSWTGPVPAR